jgi:hypothetical protein
MDLEWIVNKRTRNGDPLLIFGPMSVTKTPPHGSPQDVKTEVKIFKPCGKPCRIVAGIKKLDIGARVRPM